MIRLICLLFLLTKETQGAQCACAIALVNVRTGAGTENTILGTLDDGECHLDKGSRQNISGYEWANIDYNGKDAWVSDTWLHFQACSNNSGATGDAPGCPHIISRAEWGARAPTNPASFFPELPHYVIIHHGASNSCHTKQECTALVKYYQSYHMDGRGFTDIGYNFVVGEDGNIYEARGWDKIGVHTLGYNSAGIAICVIGNFQDHVPNDAALDAIKSLIACGLRINKIPSNYVLIGARDVNSSVSPGQKLYDLIKTWPHYKH